MWSSGVQQRRACVPAASISRFQTRNARKVREREGTQQNSRGARSYRTEQSCGTRENPSLGESLGSRPGVSRRSWILQALSGNTMTGVHVILSLCYSSSSGFLVLLHSQRLDGRSRRDRSHLLDFLGLLRLKNVTLTVQAVYVVMQRIAGSKTVFFETSSIPRCLTFNATGSQAALRKACHACTLFACLDMLRSMQSCREEKARSCFSATRLLALTAGRPD